MRRFRSEPRPLGSALFELEDGPSINEMLVRYLITFSCYGTRFHGDESGSVDPDHRLAGSPYVQPNPERVDFEIARSEQIPYGLDEPRRAAVLSSIIQHCQYRGWSLLAAHVRSNHVHVVLEADVAPEKVMNQLKSYASRELNRLGIDPPDRKRWARHGSTRWLHADESVRAAIRYVVEAQGEPMAVYLFEAAQL